MNFFTQRFIVVGGLVLLSLTLPSYAENWPDSKPLEPIPSPPTEPDPEDGWPQPTTANEPTTQPPQISDPLENVGVTERKLPDLNLAISPEIQKKPVWCWAAVSAMIFRFYGLSNPNRFGDWQCGIVGTVALMYGNMACNFDCEKCVVPAGSGDVLAAWIRDFPVQLGYGAIIGAEHLNSAISRSEIVRLIGSGNPIIAGITPGNPSAEFGSSEHVALIIGFRDGGDTLVVNDPYPFWIYDLNPYGDAGGESVITGRYEINYDDFIEELGWRETIVVEIRD